MSTGWVIGYVIGGVLILAVVVLLLDRVGRRVKEGVEERGLP